MWPVVVSLPFVRSSHTKSPARTKDNNNKKTSPETHKNFSHVVTWGAPKYFNFLLFFQQKNQAQQLGEEEKTKCGQFVGSLGPLFFFLFTPEFCFFSPFVSQSKIVLASLRSRLPTTKRIPNKSLTDLVFLFRFLLLASTPNFKRKKTNKNSFFDITKD